MNYFQEDIPQCSKKDKIGYLILFLHSAGSGTFGLLRLKFFIFYLVHRENSPNCTFLGDFRALCEYAVCMSAFYKRKILMLALLVLVAIPLATK